MVPVTPRLATLHFFYMHPGGKYEAEYARCLSALIANINAAVEFNLSVNMHVHSLSLFQAKESGKALPAPDRARLRSQVLNSHGA